ncbi:DUF4870 domain-containing protein [Patescibacteria group bacterium]|nr:MAG: DUF4870 domain-containing protein [Patescibacteria group bacterium]
MTEEQKIEQPTVAKADPADVEKNKAMAIVGYIVQILFFVPLVTEDGKKSPFAKFHANQQLNLLLFGAGAYIASMVLVAVSFGMLFFVPMLVWIADLVLIVMGVINAANGEMKPLPVIGGFTLIK